MGANEEPRSFCVEEIDHETMLWKLSDFLEVYAPGWNRHQPSHQKILILGALNLAKQVYVVHNGRQRQVYNLKFSPFFGGDSGSAYGRPSTLGSFLSTRFGQEVEFGALIMNDGFEFIPIDVLHVNVTGDDCALLVSSE